MILVDIWVPAMDKTYDFRLDENMAVGSLVEEIAEAICQKEQCHLEGQTADLTLWRLEQALKLPKAATLRENQVWSGEKLRLV